MESDTNSAAAATVSPAKADCTTNSGASTEYIQFKWHQEVPQYGDKLLQRLDEFRKKNMFHDVTLKAYDAELAAHKVVLAACGGMFRNHFVDPKTKMIAVDVTEVKFDCPASGLRPILKFAYSGKLEITHENVLPTLQAAIITEMKEVQEICAEIVMSKLNWLLSYDGTEASLEGHKPSKHLPNNADEVMDVLRLLLVKSVPHFSQAPARDEISEEEAKSYPCYGQLREKFPDLVRTYLSVVDIVTKAKRLHRPKSTSAPPKSENTEGIKTAETNHTQNEDNEAQKNGIDQKIKENGVDSAGETASKPKGETPKPAVPHPKERSVTHKPKKLISNTEPGNNAAEPDGKNATRPKSKPRSVTAPAPVPTLPPNPEPKKRPPSPPKEPPKQRALSQSVAGSPDAPGRKKSAPKPPVPPPMTPLSRTPSAPPRIGKTPPPRPTGKVPPPRPRPPSVKKKLDENKTSPTTKSYDDALNPFAIDEEDEEEAKEENIKTTNGEHEEVGVVSA